MRKIIALFAVAVLTTASLSSISAQGKKWDWAKFVRYEEQNKALKEEPLAVLMGDSITDGWPTNSPEFFTDNNLAGRGISGQTSSEMLVRFRADVIDLKPKMVVICAGTNDVAENNGVIAHEYILGNLESMVELARLHNIVPVLCSVLPADRFSWNKNIVDPAPTIIKLNKKIRAFAKKNKIAYVNYHKAMRKKNGAMIEEYSNDGVHPTLAGYHVMESVLLPIIKEVEASLE